MDIHISAQVLMGEGVFLSCSAQKLGHKGAFRSRSGVYAAPPDTSTTREPREGWSPRLKRPHWLSTARVESKRADQAGRPYAAKLLGSQPSRHVRHLVPTDTSPSLVRLHGLDRSDRVQTYAEVHEAVRRVQAALEDRGYRCRPNSALGSLFQKARLLDEQWQAQTDAQDILTLMQADDAVRIARAVEEVLDDPQAAEPIRRITKSDMHLTTRQPSQGKDALWELNLLSFLRRRGVPVRLQEPPDLALTLPGLLGDYGFACKKVYGEDSVKSQLRKGCQQLNAMGGPGVVAFNLDDLAPERSVLVQPTHQAANDTLHGLNIAFMQRHQWNFQEAVMAGKCDGVLLATTVQADVQTMSPRFNRVAEVTLWTVAEAPPGAHLRIAALRELVERRG